MLQSVLVVQLGCNDTCEEEVKKSTKVVDLTGMHELMATGKVHKKISSRFLIRFGTVTP